ncbi:MAG: hypothetical protein AAF430_23815 [Myxococcota bacterium]
MRAFDRAIPVSHPSHAPDGRPTTLLALIQAIGDVTPDDREVVATVVKMLRDGEVRLCGILRDTPLDEIR